MKKQAISAAIVLVILGVILSSCAAPTSPKDTILIDELDWVNPKEGTIGTEFTVTGSGFGDSKPTVRVGDGNCAVLTWNDTEIRAVLADVLAASKYDVTIEPAERNAAQILVQDAFTVLPPSIFPLTPMDVSPLNELTIKGSFFGSEAGRVYMEDPEGQETNCQLLKWSMESITFAVPDGLFGIHDIVIKNNIGTASQTRVLNVTLPELPYIGAGPLQTGTRDYNVQERDIDGWWLPTTSATGIYYGGKFWAFFCGWDIHDRSHSVQYSRFGYYKDGTPGWIERGRVAPGGERDQQLSLYAPSPVIFKGNLYVFWVDKKTSVIMYSMYKDNDLWDGPRNVSSPSSGNVIADGEVSPVYNPVTKDIELLYMSGNKVYWMHTKDGENWSNPFLIKGVQTNSPPTAEVVETGENEFQIMLAARSVADDTIQIIFISNGRVTKSYPLINVYDENEKEHTYHRPFLTNLGHGEIALLWRGTENRVNVVYYDEKSKTFHDKYTWPKKPQWAHSEYPTGAVGFDVRDDALLATFWVFYAKEGYIFSINQSELGMWKHINTEQYDWAEIEEKEIWNLYPVVGVIDMPPFVLNGNTTADENKTKVTFEHGKEHATTIDTNLQAGMYFKMQPELGLNIEAHAGITKQWSKETTVTSVLRYSLEARVAPQIRVLYLAPVFEMIEYRWYDEAHQGTEDIIIVPVVKDASIIARLVDPSTDPNFEIPPHEVGNLDTYRAVLDSSLYDISVSASWDAGGPTEISLGEKHKELKGEGGYIKFSIGYNFLWLTGFGAEGEFDVKYTDTTTTTDSVVVTLENAKPSVPGDIKSFTTTVYWAMPNGDGYWVPKNRRGLGDKPWFITYTAGQIIPYE